MPSSRTNFISLPSGGDVYIRLDRFGRVVDQYYFNNSGGTLARYQYGYDNDGNVMFIDDLTSGGSNFSKVYTYDPLDRLETYTEGEFGSITGSAAATETWGLDTYGNWDVETINGVAQYNTINSQNELTAFNSSSANQSFDPNGNTLSGSTGGVYIYNAWNQMTSETLSSVTQSFTYDALGQRITLTSGSTTQYQYYSSGGQVIETDTVADGTGSAISQYVWGLMYVNDLLVRDDNAVSGDLGGGISSLGWPNLPEGKMTH